MIVDPDFLDHWRTRMLVDALGDEMAPLYVIRIWAHCQLRRGDTFVMPSAGIKALCRAPGDAAQLETALVDSGFIERAGDTLSVPKWSEKNASLIAAWENGSKGGRPKKEPTRNPWVTEPEPMANPAGTQQEPMANPRRTHAEPIRLREEEEKTKTTSKTKTARQRAAPAVLVTIDALLADGLAPETASAWLAHRRAKKAVLSDLAWAGFKSESDKAGWNYERAVTKAIARNWTSFEAAWVSDAKTSVETKTSFTRDREAAAARWIGSAKLSGIRGSFVDLESADGPAHAIR